MAEAMARVLVPDELKAQVDFSSAGCSAIDGRPATGYAVEAVSLRGGDLSGHSSRLLTNAMIEEADLLIAMTGEHVDHILRLDPKAHSRTFKLGSFGSAGSDEDIPDPIGAGQDVYIMVLAQIERFIRSLIDELGARFGAETGNG